MYGYIYKITNNVNGKIYIGQTKHSIEYRWKQHCYRSTYEYKNGSIIDEAINKYGKENFTVEQLDTANTPDELNEKEKYYIEKLNSIVEGYNITEGCNSVPIKSQSKEANIKRSISLKRAYSEGRISSKKGTKRSAEDRLKISIGQMGRKHSEETKLKISLSQKGRPANHVTTDEIKKKISEGLKRAYAEGKRTPNGKGVGGRHKRDK